MRDKKYEYLISITYSRKSSSKSVSADKRIFTVVTYGPDEAERAAKKELFRQTGLTESELFMDVFIHRGPRVWD